MLKLKSKHTLGFLLVLKRFNPSSGIKLEASIRIYVKSCSCSLASFARIWNGLEALATSLGTSLGERQKRAQPETSANPGSFQLLPLLPPQEAPCDNMGNPSAAVHII